MSDPLTGKPRPGYARAVEDASVVRAMSRELDRLRAIEEAARAWFADHRNALSPKEDGCPTAQALRAALEGAPDE